MEKADGGYWRFLSDSAKPGTEYVYQLDKKTNLPDPASQFQPYGVFGSSMVVDHEAYRWRDAGWRGIDLNDAVFYEVHIGAFTPREPSERRLPRGGTGGRGINALELMPLRSSRRPNWGYDTAFPFAPEQLRHP
jgi:maltooligosyltrehalose trehalohydrolase